MRGKRKYGHADPLEKIPWRQLKRNFIGIPRLSLGITSCWQKMNLRIISR
jgi:hypothetical protein